MEFQSNMRFYITPIRNRTDDSEIIKGLKHCYPNAIPTTDIEEADLVVLPKGWTRSRKCLQDYTYAKDNHIKTAEAYLYTKWITAHAN